MILKRLVSLLTLVLCICVFLMPMTVFAAEDDVVDDVETEKADSDLSDTDVVGDTYDTDGTVSAIPDDALTSDGALTPDGTGTILDHVIGDDDKQFYTITTEDGSIFYLIIDGDRDENNVYFLNAVTIADLVALAEKTDSGSVSAIPSEESCVCNDKCEAGRVNIECEVCKKDLTVCVGNATQTAEPTEDATTDTDDTGLLIFIVIAVAAVAGVGCYIKIIRPKNQVNDSDDDFDDEDYGEDFDPDREYGHTDYLPDDDGYDDPDDDDGFDGADADFDDDLDE